MTIRPLLLLALTGLAPANADIVPAPLFRDGAVLQQGKPLPVWGSADPGESVTVAFAGQSPTATAAPDGRWRVTLPPLSASTAPRELVMRGKNTVVVRDVLVGEVWLASGQSNMEWPLSHSADPREEIAAARFPLIRHFNVERHADTVPLTTAEGGWSPATSEHAGKFSAVAHHFAVALHGALDTPVGIINSTWGGSALEAWMDEPTFLADPARARRLAGSRRSLENYPAALTRHEAALAAWEKEKAAAQAADQPFDKKAPRAPRGPDSHTTLAGSYNGMIHPLVPYALRGVIWYQGEGNVRRADDYARDFPALITGWRAAFGQGDFPFYWVQLPNFDLGRKNDSNWQWAQLREAQTKTLSVHNTGQAVTIDVGEDHGLHPKNKKPVGQRLARLALARTYGAKDVIDSGPEFKAAHRDGTAWRVTFEPSPSPLRAAPGGLTGFELAGADRIFHPAEARIDGDTVIVISPAVPEPVALRYAYRNAPQPGLFNADGLPAAPFRTDNW